MSNWKNAEILKHFGKQKQVIQSIEEMSELTKELIKNINRDAKNKLDIGSEIADVINMIDQLCLIYDFKLPDLLNAADLKCDRTLIRIREEK